MFSEHAHTTDGILDKHWFIAAAGIVIICQLIALMLLADSQVAKAKVRDELQSAQRLAVAHCIETSVGPKRHSCIREATMVAGTSLGQQRPDRKPVVRAVQLAKTLAPVTVSANENGATPAAEVRALMPAVLAVR